jgi:hypothetical protein
MSGQFTSPVQAELHDIAVDSSPESFDPDGFAERLGTLQQRTRCSNVRGTQLFPMRLSDVMTSSKTFRHPAEVHP